MFKKLLLVAVSAITFSAVAVPNTLDTRPKFDKSFVALHPVAMNACVEIAPELSRMALMFIADDASQNSVFVSYSALEFYCPFLLTYEVRERTTTQDSSEYVLKSNRPELNKYPVRFKMLHVPEAGALVAHEYNDILDIFDNGDQTILMQGYLVTLRNLMAKRINLALEGAK